MGFIYPQVFLIDSHLKLQPAFKYSLATIAEKR